MIDVQNIEGMLLPAEELHFAETLRKLSAEGKSSRYPVMERALELLPGWRRRSAIDIGAHIGLWARWLVREFHWVHAFEPIGEYAELLRENVPECKVYRTALGSTNGRVTMKTYPDNTGQAHIDAKLSSGNLGGVLMAMLDDYRFKHVDLVKIDVEGYELEVLKGAQSTLLRNKPILILEQRGCDEVNFGRPRDEALPFLHDLGMTPLACIGADYIMGWA